MIERRNTPLRERWEDLFWYEDAIAKLDEQSRKAVAGKIDRMKQRIRWDSRLGNDPLEKPLTQEWRRVYRNDGETVLEYRIYPGNWDDVLDEEIEEELRPLEVHNFSQYDCTGKLCTAWLTWKRVKAGLSVCHCLCLDV